MRRHLTRGLALLALCSTYAAAAASDVRYQYDARGRLTSVVQSGAGPYRATYAYDAADNRVSRTVTGVSAALAVVPIGGSYRVIPLRAQ